MNNGAPATRAGTTAVVVELVSTVKLVSDVNIDIVASTLMLSLYADIACRPLVLATISAIVSSESASDEDLRTL